MIRFSLDTITNFLDYLLQNRGLDYTGYSPAVIERQIHQRVSETNSGTVPKYFQYVASHPDEIDHLIDSLTINASGFFRDPLVFNFLSSKILPSLISEKIASGNTPLRIWSAGCAAGEEPYSIALEIDKLLKNKPPGLAVNIFATDIDAKILDKARAATYIPKSLTNVCFEHLKYFVPQGDSFFFDCDIKRIVRFSLYDLLDKKSYCPTECLYGAFDIILCRNVLIYYNTQYQNRIFVKLFRAINENGYLVLGETETLPAGYQNYFRKVTDCCNIFMKIS